MKYYQCRFCGDELDNYLDEFCSRDCMLEAKYQTQVPICKKCRGSGRDCDVCMGTGHCEEQFRMTS